MKIPSLIFIVLIILIALKYYKIIELSNIIFAGIFCLWMLVIYIKVHNKNKDRDTPHPVYITTQQ